MTVGESLDRDNEVDGAGPGPNDRRLALVVGVIGSIVAVVAARGRFPGIGNDAVSYIAIADHVADGRGLGYFLESPLGLWPPGWPLVLAFFRWAFDIDPQHTALVINALCPIAVALLTRSIMRMLTNDRRLIAVGIIVATLGPATLSQMYFVQTEPTFIVLTLLSIWSLYRFSGSARTPGGTRWWFLVLAIVTQWVAFMDRYVGLVLIGSGALWLVFDRGFPTFSQRLRNGLVFFAGSVVVPGAWIVRNQIVVGSPFGIRDTPIATYKTNAIDAITSVGQYIHGYSAYEPFTGLARLATWGILACCGVGALVLLRRALAARRARLGADAAPLGPGDFLGHRVGLLAIYAAAHWAYMIYSASTIAFDPVNTRYLVPMFVPTLMVALVLIDKGAFGLRANADRRGDWVVKLAGVGLVAFLVVQLGVGAVRMSASYWTDLAQRYNSETAVRIQDSEVFDQIPDDCRLYSNFPEFTYLAGVEAQRSARITKFASSDRQTDLADLHRAIDEDGDSVCLIWVDDDASDVFDHPSYQYPLRTFEEQFELEQVAGDDDVAVYRIHPAA